MQTIRISEQDDGHDYYILIIVQYQFVAGMLLSFGLSVVMAMWRVVAAPGQRYAVTPMAE